MDSTEEIGAHLKNEEILEGEKADKKKVDHVTFKLITILKAKMYNNNNIQIDRQIDRQKCSNLFKLKFSSSLEDRKDFLHSQIKQNCQKGSYH